MSQPPNAPKKKKNEVVLLEHEYDGIQEYDQKLPNWWLFTLYGAMIIAVVYWFVFFTAGAEDQLEELEQDMAMIERMRLEQSIDITDASLFWSMAGNPGVVVEGKAIYESNCLNCHGAELNGRDPNTGIDLPGVNLVDNGWIHGHQPDQIYNTIYHGVQGKGMAAWGSQLGQQRIVKVVAYILNQHGDQATMEAQAEVVVSP